MVVTYCTQEQRRRGTKNCSREKDNRCWWRRVKRCIPSSSLFSLISSKHQRSLFSMLPPLLLLSFVLLVPLLLCTLTGVQGTLDLSHYTLTFNQDFTTMTSLGVTPWGPTNQTHRMYPLLNHLSPSSSPSSPHPSYLIPHPSHPLTSPHIPSHPLTSPHIPSYVCPPLYLVRMREGRGSKRGVIGEEEG